MKKMLVIILVSLVVVVVAALLGITLGFNSTDHSEFDHPTHISTGMSTSESAQHKAMASLVVTGMTEMAQLDREEMMYLMRKKMNERGEAFENNAKVLPVNTDGVNAEWVIAPNANPNRHLLYIHGGGYMIGSPKSHRLITSRLSEISDSVVLSIDYRLVPEHSRMAGIEDSRTAYSWLLKNGPEGRSPAQILIVAGDSSGGNLVLSVIAWARDTGLRAANAVVAFSPQTDLTLASLSLVKNIDTDIMQEPSFGPIVKAPNVFSLGFSFLSTRSIRATRLCHHYWATSRNYRRPYYRFRKQRCSWMTLFGM